MSGPANIDTETAAQFISMKLSQYERLDFQILNPTPQPGIIGIRLHTDEQYCLVHAVSLLECINEKFPSRDWLRAALNKKRRMNHKREGK